MAQVAADSTLRGRAALLWWAMVVVVALAAGGGAWWLSAEGMAVTNDSSTYLGVVENLRDGRGPTTPFPSETNRSSPEFQVANLGNLPLEDWPPGYSIGLWVLTWFGLSPVGGARVVGVAATIALVVAVAVLGRRLVGTAPSVAIAAAAVFGPMVADQVVVPGDLLGLSITAITDVTAMALSFAALTVGVAALHRRSDRLTVVAAMLVAGATLTRFNLAVLGLALGAAGLLLATAMRRSEPTRSLVRLSLVLAVVGPATVVAWTALNSVAFGGGAPKSLAWHPDTVDVAKLLDVLGSWLLLPGSWPAVLRLIVVLAMLGVPTVAAIAGLNARSDLDSLIGRVLGLYVVGLLAALLLSQLLLDAVIPTDQRMLLSVRPAVYLLVGSFVIRSADRAPGLPSPQVSRAAFTVAALVVCLAPLSRLPSNASDAHDYVRLTNERLAASPLRDLPPDLMVFTNLPSGLYLATGHPVLKLPTEQILTTDRPNDQYDEQIRSVGELVRNAEGLVALAPAYLEQAVDLDQFENDTALTAVATCPDGVILYASPPSRGTTLGTAARGGDI